MSKTQNAKIFARSLRSLVTIYEISLKFLAFWSISYHECYKHEDIIVPTKFVFEQQDIEILKSCMYKTQKLEKLWVARSAHLQSFRHF